jgi:hypothetical protein
MVLIITHPTSRIDSSFFRGAHSRFVTQEDRPAEKKFSRARGLVFRVKTPMRPQKTTSRRTSAGRTNEERGKTRALISLHPSRARVSVVVV